MQTRIFMEGKLVAVYDLPHVPQLGSILSIDGNHWRVNDMEICYDGSGKNVVVDRVYLDVEESRLRRAKFKQEQTPMRMN
jgi:hypothetical protein